MKSPFLLLILSIVLAAPMSHGQDKRHLEIESEFGSYVADDFPYFCQTLDAREFGENPETDNLTPRGIVVRLGSGYWACFDPDLLRWSLIWKENDEGEFLTMDGMAPGSYRLPNRKAPAGQESLPRPIGTPISASPELPGWKNSPGSSDTDPRDHLNAEEGEVGLGPIPESMGRFSGVRVLEGGVQIEYTVGDAQISEQLAGSSDGVIRKIAVANLNGPISLRTAIGEDPWKEISPETETGTLASTKGYQISLVESLPATPAPAMWPEPVTVRSTPAEGTAPFVFDDLSLPVPNPWKRNVRLSGFDFFSDGSAAFCTFDGDVWIVENLSEGQKETTWKRFASGLHEPKTICIVEDEIFVSDRNGIVKLHDTDKNGEADWYENFSNIVPQTAETREFAMDMAAIPDGGFYLAKGGQIGNTRGIANGTVVKVSPDGRSYEIVATGLRQPYIGYDPETGILTSSDQQGHWKPATPIYRIEQGKYYGFQPAKLKDKAVHPAPINPPEVWIPHFINQSGASQVWMKGPDGTNADMGALNKSLVHIGYNRPELFKVFLDDDRNQGAVAPILSGFPSGILKGRVNPADGRLYVCGFEIWGTSGSRISGLFRVRPAETKSWLPRKIKAFTRGVLLTFDHELDPELASDLGRYSVDRWNYEQTHNYGSGNFKLNGEPGQESVALASANLSTDRKSLFLALADMAPSHSLRVTYRIPVADSMQVDSAYLTVWALDKVDLTSIGFETDEIDMEPKRSLTGTGEKIKPTVEIGKAVALQYGCIACHATGDGTTPAVPAPATAAEGAQVAVGPPWTGLWKSYRTFSDGSFIKSVDETYLRESILDPGRRVAEGFETEKTGVGMPSYLGVLKDHEIESIILYIKTLGKGKGKGKKKA